MSTYEKLNLTLQVVVGVAIIATFIVYWLMLRTMSTAAIAQNVLRVIIDFLQTTEMKDALFIVRTTLRRKALPWSTAEEKAAQLVGTRYDVLGILIQRREVPADIFFENWGSSIIDCREILDPYIRQLKQASGPKYYDDFDWLYLEACKRHQKSPISL